MAGRTLAEAAVRVRANSTVRRDVDDDVRKIDGKRAGSTVGRGFSSGFKGALTGLGSAFAAVGAAKFLGSAIEEAREAAKVTRLTNAVIKSTGGVARVSAAGVASLAERLSNKVAVDDEVIQSGANLLLTFTKVRNEAGKGNDIFNQGVTIATDMSAALGKDLNSSVMLVGKALNDPIKGISALTRAGVSFTQKQKDQIKAMVESGNIMGAQKMILSELKTEFGGAGAAAADPAEKAKVAWGNFKEMIGNALLPVLNKVFAFLMGPVTTGVRAMIAAFREGDVTSDGFIGAFERVGVVLRTIWLGIKAMIAAFKEGDVTSNGFVGVMERIGVTLRWVFEFVRGTAIPAISSFIGWLAKGSTGAEVLKAVIVALTAGFVAFKIAMAVQMAITKAFIAVQTALNLVMSLNPIGLIVVALIALAAGLVYAYKRSETFRNFVNKLWNSLKQAGRDIVMIWNGVINAFKEFFAKVSSDMSAFGNFLKAVWNGIVAAVRFAIDGVKAYINGWIAVIRGVGALLGWLWRNVAIPVWNGIREVVAVAVSIVRRAIEGWIVIIRSIGSFLGWLWRTVAIPVWNGIRAVISAAVAIVVRSIQGWISIIRSVAAFLTALWRNTVIPVWNGIRNTISNVWNRFIWPVFRSFRDVLTRTIPQAFASFIGAVTSRWNAFRNVISTVWNRYVWPVFRSIRDVITKTIPGAFRSGVSVIGNWWSAIQARVRDPINWVISYVINRGIIENINKVKKWLGVGGKDIGWVSRIGSTPRAPGPASAPTGPGRFALGGVVPGYAPRQDKVHALVSPGEGIMVPEFVRAVGKRTIHMWNRMAMRGRLPRFAKGGVVGDGTVGGPGDFIDDIMQVMNNPFAWLQKRAGLDRIADHVKGQMGTIAKGAANKIIGFGKEKLTNWLQFWEGFGGGVYLGRDPTRSISTILSVAKRFYSGARVSSGYRPGDPGYHGRGLAADLIGGGAAGMRRMAAGFMGMSGRLIELIHSGGGGYFVKNGRRVGASYYRSVIAGHYNHVHVAARRDALLRSAVSSLVGAGQLGSWVSAAMAITRTSPSWFAALVGLAKHESGGNPRAINLWDSNARRGTPSKGLFQTIDSTFNRWKLPGLGNIWNPIHNAVAAIRYIKGRYGSIFNIPSYRGGGRFVGGYEMGGFVPQTGFAKVHKGEQILSVQERRKQLEVWLTMIDRMDTLIAATENVGPQVGRELTGGMTSARNLARRGVRPR